MFGRPGVSRVRQLVRSSELFLPRLPRRRKPSCVPRHARRLNAQLRVPRQNRPREMAETLSAVEREG